MSAHLLSLSLLFSSSAFDDRTPLRFEFESKHMGTTFRIVLYTDKAETAKKAADVAFARVAELDGIMSDYKQTSELMQLCKKFATEIGEPGKASDDLFFVL